MGRDGIDLPDFIRQDQARPRQTNLLLSFVRRARCTLNATRSKVDAVDAHRFSSSAINDHRGFSLCFDKHSLLWWHAVNLSRQVPRYFADCRNASAGGARAGEVYLVSDDEHTMRRRGCFGLSSNDAENCVWTCWLYHDLSLFITSRYNCDVGKTQPSEISRSTSHRASITTYITGQTNDSPYAESMPISPVSYGVWKDYHRNTQQSCTAINISSTFPSSTSPQSILSQSSLYSSFSLPTPTSGTNFHFLHLASGQNPKAQINPNP